MIDVVKDLSILTTIPENYLTKLLTKINYIICDAVAEADLVDQDVVDFNFNGTIISIKLEGDKLSYHIVPSTELHKELKNTLLNGTNVLEDRLEKSLVNKITEVYKDLL